MISKILEKRIKSLYTKKGRLKNNSFIIEGKRSLLTAIHNSVNIKNIVLSKSFIEKNKNLATYNKYKTSVVDDKCFNQLSQVDSPSGILAEAAIPLHKQIKSRFSVGVFRPNFRPWEPWNNHQNLRLVWNKTNWHIS